MSSAWDVGWHSIASQHIQDRQDPTWNIPVRSYGCYQVCVIGVDLLPGKWGLYVLQAR